MAVPAVEKAAERTRLHTSRELFHIELLIFLKECYIQVIIYDKKV
jgi:hypothetical protein